MNNKNKKSTEDELALSKMCKVSLGIFVLAVSKLTFIRSVHKQAKLNSLSLPSTFLVYSRGGDCKVSHATVPLKLLFLLLFFLYFCFFVPLPPLRGQPAVAMPTLLAPQ